MTEIQPIHSEWIGWYDPQKVLPDADIEVLIQQKGGNVSFATFDDSGAHFPAGYCWKTSGITAMPTTHVKAWAHVPGGVK